MTQSNEREVEVSHENTENYINKKLRVSNSLNTSLGTLDNYNHPSERKSDLKKERDRSSDSLDKTDNNKDTNL